MANRAIRLESDGEGLWLEVGFCSVVYMTFEEAQELAYRVRAFLDASPIPNDVVSATGLEVTLPHIAPPDDLYDEASAYRAVLAANFSIQAEARAVYGDPLSDGECLDRVIAARWPTLLERDAYLAAAAHYEVELPLTPTQQSEAEMAGERA